MKLNKVISLATLSLVSMSAVSCGQQEVISPVDDLTQIASTKKTPKVKMVN